MNPVHVTSGWKRGRGAWAQGWRFVLSVFSALSALWVLGALWCPPALAATAAEGQLLRIPSREGVETPVFWVQQDQAPATLVLLPGGAGGIGKLDDSGWPGGRNFLIRSGKLLAAHGFNLVMVSKPSDMDDLHPDLRLDPRHLQDLAQVLRAIRQRTDAPIWLVGTSRGTISATAAAIAERNSGLVAGVVLTSSVTNFKWRGAVPRQALDLITVPVLVMHHEQDECWVCRPHEAPLILKGLTLAPVKKLLMVNGGSGATGNPCEAEHHHGYIGMEQEAVDLIANWVKHPAP